MLLDSLPKHYENIKCPKKTFARLKGDPVSASIRKKIVNKTG